MNKIVLAGAALAALAPLPASSQPPFPGRAPDRAVTRAEIEARVQARFAQADADHDGFVTRDEVQARGAARADRFEGRRGQGREALFARLDADRDGVLSREEFDAPRGSLRGGARRERAPGAMMRGGGGFRARIFAALDGDGDGRVSLREAQSRALRLFERADANRDGTVTPDERRAARQALRRRG
ncbi:MAG: EF-hand domain-containing protein [Alphaproteobacteria bacterium]|nr:EF-hand domain-containing protein [Alphaproteobacteria bacterium]MBV9371896.1 EF-hand domain-containing protein [Alphaproteobacteria bacterium]MBV9902282.1 EF-hand domain-containing protein [Alphaproteobacteria bacterium]